MSTVVNVLADLLLAILLVSTIASSVALSRRITKLKADESAMRKTAAELIVASETAERAIAGLRTTLGECDRTLADRLRTAERYAADLAGQVAAGEAVMSRIAQIVESSRAAAPSDAPPARAPHDERLGAAALAAQALSERAARRLESRAA
jgi:hypothetical protein